MSTSNLHNLDPLGRLNVMREVMHRPPLEPGFADIIPTNDDHGCQGPNDRLPGYLSTHWVQVQHGTALEMLIQTSLQARRARVCGVRFHQNSEIDVTFGQGRWRGPQQVTPRLCERLIRVDPYPPAREFLNYLLVALGRIMEREAAMNA